MKPNQQENERQDMPKHIDYKDTELLKKFLNPHARIMSRRRTGLAAGEQRNLAMAIKRARFMALLPFVSR